MDYPFLVGAIVLGLVWLIGTSAERFKDYAKIAAVLATIALALQSLIWLVAR